MADKIDIEGALSQNRAEEHGNDLWEIFVIPPFYKELDVFVARKPRVIIGGRGCGKTMLLKYLSHDTQFSTKRKAVPEDTITHIGLYWRIDTHFASMMTKRNVTDDVWENAFEHLASLLISIEILKSLKSIANSKFDNFSTKEFLAIDLTTLQNFDSQIPSNASECERYLTNKLWQFQSWLNNVKKVQEPLFLPMAFIKALIQEVKRQFPNFEPANYFVYLDEYENLLPQQQRIINTWLKHSEMPLIFNLAMKRNSFNEKRTTGNESLVMINDYRQFDLEDYYSEENMFAVFAAEILFLKLQKRKVKNLPINESHLRDVDRLDTRTNLDYRRKVINYAERIFPGLSQIELAKEVFGDKVLAERLQQQIKEALRFRNSKIPASKFIKSKGAEASIIIPALLYRRREQPEDLLEQFNRFVKGEDNHFSGKRNWLHNNFMGCILLLYEPLPRICPIYSGFSTFCLMSHGNIRHLLELCHKSISNADVDVQHLKISQKYQTAAAKQTSTAYLGEVKNFGRYGNDLHAFVHRLGALFYHAHKRKTQSEPEPTHFSIDKGHLQFEDKHLDFLEEALKWSVLFDESSTKEKSGIDGESREYILNPIYAPYFKISYRKGRKIKLSSVDFIKLIEGTTKEYERFLRKYIDRWDVEIEATTATLFSELKSSGHED